MIYEVGLMNLTRNQRLPVSALGRLVQRGDRFAFYAKVRPSGSTTRFAVVDPDGVTVFDQLGSAAARSDSEDLVVTPTAPELHDGTPYALVVESSEGRPMRVALPAFRRRGP